MRSSPRLFNESSFNLLDEDPLEMLRELKKGAACASLYTETPKNNNSEQDMGDFSREVGAIKADQPHLYDIEDSKAEESEDIADPADMMRIFGNEEALFMTLSENNLSIRDKNLTIDGGLDDSKIEESKNNTTLTLGPTTTIEEGDDDVLEEGCFHDEFPDLSLPRNLDKHY